MPAQLGGWNPDPCDAFRRNTAISWRVVGSVGQKTVPSLQPTDTCWGKIVSMYGWYGSAAITVLTSVKLAPTCRIRTREIEFELKVSVNDASQWVAGRAPATVIR